MQLIINGKTSNFDAKMPEDSSLGLNTEEMSQLNVTQLMAILRLTGKRLAIELNGEIVPRSQFSATLLADGDVLEIVGAVGGG